MLMRTSVAGKIYIYVLLSGQLRIIPSYDPVLGVVGKEVVLPCQLEAKAISEGVLVQWTLIGNSLNTEVTTYDGKNAQNPVKENKAYLGRTNFFQSEINKGNLSLHLKNVMVSDKGKYICSVSLENWYDEVVVDLDVAGEWNVRYLFLLTQCSCIPQLRTMGYCYPCGRPASTLVGHLCCHLDSKNIFFTLSYT